MRKNKKIKLNKCLYDPGSQATLINSKIMKRLKSELIKNKVIFKSISGLSKDISRGRAKIEMKIGDRQESIVVHVVKHDAFDYDLLLGLDAIKKFKLIQDDQLKLWQREETGRVRRLAEVSRSGENGPVVRSVNFNEYISVKEYEANLDHLDKERKEKIKKLIDRHLSIFAKNKFDIGTVSDHEAQIRLTEMKYPAKKPYRTSIPDQIEIEEQVARLLESGLIEEFTSPLAAPVTLVYRQKDGSKARLCIDFRDLNKLIVSENQPFPRIEDILIKAGRSRWFTTVDLNSAFWSVPIRLKDRYKTGFVTQSGHWQWRVLPFGLKSSPGIFQRILAGIIRKHKLSGFCVNYIDDVLIFSDTFEEHLEHIERLMEAIKTEGFRLKLLKCSFAKSSVKYLGHIIAQNKVQPINDNLKSIREFERPRSPREVRRWLGKINFYYKFIENASAKLEPLHNLLKKGVKFKWTADCDESFNQIKDYLCSSPILAIYDQNREVFIFTDASDQGLGAVLKQPDDEGMLHPVAYFSKRLGPRQKKQSVIYKECLAIKEAISFWKYWLIGRNFQVISDHRPLEEMRVKARTDEPLGDLMFYLSQFDFKIKYAPGKTNIEADSLSRGPVLQEFERNEDLRLVNVIELIKLEEILLDQRTMENEIKKAKKIVRTDGIYYKLLGNRKRIYVSKKFGREIIRRAHDDEFGHIGTAQLLAKIRPHYYFKHLDKSVDRFCMECETCNRNKTRKRRSAGLLSRLGPAERPLQIISIDSIGGFAGYGSTKKYIHLAVDHFTRYGWILTSSRQTASEFIKLLKPIVERGKVDIVLSDQYTGNNSKKLKKYLEERGAQMIFTATDCASSNGLNERLGQTLVNRIRCRLNESKDKRVAWSRVADRCMREYNRTRHGVTGFSPAYLLYGEKSSMLPAGLEQNTDLESDRNSAFENSSRNHEKNKRRIDRKRRDQEFKTGDLVYVHNGNKLNRGKLAEVRTGPFKVVRRISKSMYEVADGRRRSESNVFHACRMTPFVAPSQ